VVAVALTAGAPASASPAAQAPRRLAAALRGELHALVRAGVPGAVVVVRRGDRTLALAAGRADLATGEPLRARDRFKVGSITKTVVATAVLQLAGEGRLTLDDPVARWLPGLVPNGRRITIRMLLAHTSGLFDYLEDPRSLAPYVAGDFGFRWTARRLVRIGVSHPPTFPPGAGWAYSNTGYLVLGLIVERVSGRPLAAVLERRILRPLGLAVTRLPASQGLGHPRAHGYLGAAPALQDVTPVSQSLFGAAGGLVSTAGDVARFYRGLLGGRLLPPRLLRAMTATVPRAPGLAYGLGIARFATPCGPRIGHNGAVPGYASLVLNDARGRRQAVILVNAITDQETVGGPAAQAAYARLVATAVCG
jgi:D-alanyl-D-alanine carboxypeptidase